MKEQDLIRRIVSQHRDDHTPFFHRPHATRRQFFQLLGAGVTGAMLLRPTVASADSTVIKSSPVTTQNKAKNVIFILLTGAPSHTDTFDFKMSPSTPSSLQPDTVNGVVWPTGLLPKMAGELPNFAIVRTVRAWALVHSLSQTWVQIGRNPAAALGNIAPNIGSIVAIEKDLERKPGQVFPTFVALNANNQAGPGYLSAKYAPFRTHSERARSYCGASEYDQCRRLRARQRPLLCFAGARRTAADRFSAGNAGFRLRGFLRIRQGIDV